MDNRISFSSDYTKGAHPKILERLSQINFEQQNGYGTDDYCKSAADKIKKACKCPDADVFFLVGGTQTNQTVIDMILEPYEGVVAATTGHVAAHEAGAIEFSGHKVLTLPRFDTTLQDGVAVHSDQIGKIRAEDLRKFIDSFYADESHEHMVFPGAVYISHPTEYGTLYSKTELEEISKVCHYFDMPLFLDGARLGYGLMSTKTDVTLEDIARLVDVFYIGGTKVGALFGEAVVFPKGVPTRHPVPIIKQHGALLAKGWLLGLQFDTLFTDNLYLDISKNAIDMAELLREELVKRGYKLFIDSPTNQQFIIMEDEKLKSLSEHVRYGFWEKIDPDHTVIRLATDWATTENDIRKLMQYM
ncbi:threonine aldolase family protein [Butyrivibrio sp. YAB3001]|uniref:threonine aldolase family protein n=1 Tax=Butyrivibrio sp. YAB3001 TaxID=1520812 RepID=UPI0008F67ECC|nr:beta-eliminating lyase-related protein [Butyrivibrio sp. YAB3001]SFB73526.1 L-threonine aldolase [Butyrivibrio sp. YAB3001]